MQLQLRAATGTQPCGHGGDGDEGMEKRGKEGAREVKMEKLRAERRKRRGGEGWDDCRRRRLFRFVMGKADTHRGART